MAPTDEKDGAEKSKPDWAEIYADLLCHTSISIFEIRKMTIPQIDAIRGKLGKNIAIKIGMPGLFDGTPGNTDMPSDGKASKVSDFYAVANAFNGI